MELQTFQVTDSRIVHLDWGEFSPTGNSAVYVLLTVGEVRPCAQRCRRPVFV